MTYGSSITRTAAWVSRSTRRFVMFVVVMLVITAGLAYAIALLTTMPGANGAAPATTLPRWDVFWVIYTGVMAYVFSAPLFVFIRSLITALRRQFHGGGPR